MEREKLPKRPLTVHGSKRTTTLGGAGVGARHLCSVSDLWGTSLSISTTLHGLRQEVRVTELSHEEGEPTMSNFDLAPPVVGQRHLVPQLPVETRHECTDVTKLPL